MAGREVLTSSIALGSERVVRLAVAFVLAGLAARRLGPAGFGLVATALALLAIVQPIASFGLESLGIREAASARSFSTFVWQNMRLRLVTGASAGLVFAVLVGVFVWPLDPSAALAALVLCLTPMLGAHELVEHALVAAGATTRLAAVRMGGLLFSGAVRAAVLIWIPGVAALLVAGVSESVFLFLVLLLVIPPTTASGADGGPGATPAAARWRLFMSAIVVLILLNGDRIVATWVLGQSDGGEYAAAARLVEATYFIPVTVGASVAAELSRAPDRATLLLLYRRILRQVLPIVIFVVFSAGALAPSAVTLLYGERFRQAGGLVVVLSPALIGISLVSFRTRALVAAGLFGEVMTLSSFALLIHIAAFAAGIAVGGALALGAANAIAWILSALLPPLLLRSTREFHPLARTKQ